MTDAGAPFMPPNVPDSVHEGGFELGGPPEAGKHYRVLARKYRPSSFDDLIGQDAVVRTASKAFETGRAPGGRAGHRKNHHRAESRPRTELRAAGWLGEGANHSHASARRALPGD